MLDWGNLFDPVAYSGYCGVWWCWWVGGVVVEDVVSGGRLWCFMGGFGQEYGVSCWGCDVGGVFGRGVMFGRSVVFGRGAAFARGVVFGGDAVFGRDGVFSWVRRLVGCGV